MNTSIDQKTLGKRILIWVLACVVGLPLLMIALLALLSPLDLSGLKPTLEAQASDALGRPVTLESPIEISVRLVPIVTLGGLRLASVEGDQEALSLTGVEARIKLLPLISRRIRGELQIQQLALTPKNQTEPTLEVAGLALAAEGAHTTFQASGNLLAQSTDLNLRGGPIEALADPQSPWPITGELEWGELTAQLSGDLSLPLGAADLQVNTAFSMLAENAAQFGLGDDVLDSPTAPFLGLEGRLQFDGRTVRLELDESLIGHTLAQGSILIETASELHRIQGSLSADQVDLAAWTRALPPPTEARAADASTRPVNPLDLFPPLSGQIDLTLDTLDGLPMPVRELILPLVFDRDRVAIESAQARVANAPSELSVAIERVEDSLTLDGSMDIADIVLSDQTLTVDTLDGVIDGISGSLQATGTDLDSLLKSVKLDLALEGLDLTYEREVEGSHGIPIALPQSRLRLDPQQLQFNGSGVILDTEVVATATLDRPADWRAADAAWGFASSLAVDSGTVKVNGTARAEQIDSHITVDLPQPALLDAWIGERAQSLPPIRAEATLRWQPEVAALEDLALTFGEQHATGQLTISGVAPQRRLEGELVLNILNLNALIALLESSTSAAEDGQAPAGLELDMPILPERLDLPDADLTLAATKVIYPRFSMSDFRFRLLLDDGALLPSEFRGNALGAAWSGSLQFDGRLAAPTAKLSLTGRGIELSQLGKQLSLGELPPIGIDSVTAEVTAEGSALGELLSNGRTELVLEGVRWAGQDVLLRQLRSTASQGVLRLTGDGTVGPLPASVDIELPGIAALIEGKKQLPMSMEIRLADATLAMKGGFMLPVSAANLDFEIQLQGQSLAAFSPLAETPLPPIGPYQASANVGLRGQTFALSEFKAEVGQSDLNGSLRLDPSGPRTVAELDLHSERFQIDDFFWDTGSDKTDAEPDLKKPDAEEDIGAQLLGERWAQLEFLDHTDFDLKIAAESVRSGEDDLGGGQLRIQAAEGRLSLDPLVLDVPGGRVNMAVTLEQKRPGLRGSVKMEVHQFDFGILARRIDPDSPVSGDISIDADLRTEGPDLRRLLAGADGLLTIGVWPVNLSANVFDLWAVGLLNALMPSLDPESGGSVFNCVVVRLNAEDGVMRNEALLLDTSRITAGGNLEIDFKNERMRLAMQSKPKRPALFSAQPPIEVAGSFDDFRVGLASGAGFGTMVRILTSPITFPFEFLFGNRLPADGAEACRLAYQRDKAS